MKQPTKMSEAELREWLLARMRGERVVPPVSESRLESPEDHVRALVRGSADKRFHARMSKAILAALRELTAGDLRSGPDAAAVRHLAGLVDGLELRAAAPLLHTLALRGTFGGHDGAVDPDAEDMVLFALAGVQEPGALWPQWHALWQRDAPRFWPVASAGLRLSDPMRALKILPEAVARGEHQKTFPLGEVLWAYATDSHYTANDIADALAGLTLAARARSREALTALGAEPQELDAWLPSPAKNLWWVLPNVNIRRPPRFTEIAA